MLSFWYFPLFLSLTLAELEVLNHGFCLVQEECGPDAPAVKGYITEGGVEFIRRGEVQTETYKVDCYKQPGVASDVPADILCKIPVPSSTLPGSEWIFTCSGPATCDGLTPVVCSETEGCTVDIASFGPHCPQILATDPLPTADAWCVRTPIEPICWSGSLRSECTPSVDGWMRIQTNRIEALPSSTSVFRRPNGRVYETHHTECWGIEGHLNGVPCASVPRIPRRQLTINSVPLLSYFVLTFLTLTLIGVCAGAIFVSRVHFISPTACDLSYRRGFPQIERRTALRFRV
ncbi:MAG: hypothetical protein KVP17_000657 [Porospora cf. gigantea B]|uniref:uncharacterized protein n=1 Tax=Porospora cf. gigantea B TaxID=2853592 RepID=UPI00357198A8|nr:MAG: hypothetical protein KVP17_000657 [Porospora cf. gigantea B]